MKQPGDLAVGLFAEAADLGIGRLAQTAALVFRLGLCLCDNGFLFAFELREAGLDVGQTGKSGLFILFGLDKEPRG